MKSIQQATKFILFPLYFLIVLPVEYGWWKAYRKEGKTNKNLIQFIWQKM